jgi:hypothetical protein
LHRRVFFTVKCHITHCNDTLDRVKDIPYVEKASLFFEPDYEASSAPQPIPKADPLISGIATVLHREEVDTLSDRLNHVRGTITGTAKVSREGLKTFTKYTVGAGLTTSLIVFFTLVVHGGTKVLDPHTAFEEIGVASLAAIGAFGLEMLIIWRERNS